ncbi:hypothetical protein ACFWMP_13875 [Paenibacillus sp. NPDC058367]|uniref:hypothetical protein n=1 Tax=Paenibacillus sp. NPDC058367 TaxID=3346460 RepID=UPI00365A1558
MKYSVIRGYAEVEGALHQKGSSFDAEPETVKEELRKGIIVAVEPVPEKKKRQHDEL